MNTLQIRIPGHIPVTRRLEHRDSGMHGPVCPDDVPEDRDLLRKKIMTRLDLMLKNGLIEEVEFLFKRGDLHIDCHLTLPRYWDLNRVHDEIHDFEVKISEVLPTEIEIFVHVDPCLDDCCSHRRSQNQNVRH
jgi:hypothetical protein